MKWPLNWFSIDEKFIQHECWKAQFMGLYQCYRNRIGRQLGKTFNSSLVRQTVGSAGSTVDYMYI